ncbi:MAG: cell wall-binding repeat-containing protein [Actinobacteria bacterium]|nr:cell wall-binding repeat-containing protein [Actinomycetota bacterium]
MSVRSIRTAVAVLATVLTLLPLGVAQAGGSPGLAPLDEVAYEGLINGERAKAGLRPLTVHLQLTRIGRGHSGVMAADSDRGGSCGDGRTLRHRNPLDGGVTENWRSLRENVGCGSGTLGSPESLHQGFMNSPGHRANVLAPDVEHVGIGVVVDSRGTTWVTQIFMGGGTPPVLTAIGEGLKASQVTFPTDDRPDFIVVSRADLFADSLGGAALAGGDAPVLFTDGPTPAEPQPVLRPDTRVEIDRLLGGSGRVYLLGGPDALSPRVESELRGAGYDVKRLAGATRVETAIAIADETVKLRGTPDKIAVAYAWNWPDAITGGAAAGRNGVPLVLVDTNAVPAATASFLARHPKAERLVLGGSVVVSDRVLRDVSGQRLAGATRHDTALAVADGLFGAVGSRVVVIDGWDPDGWGRALAWSAYAVRNGAPTILVNDDVPSSVANWLAAQDDGVVPLFGSAVTSSARSAVEQLLAS